jgi:hypothetical protein
MKINAPLVIKNSRSIFQEEDDEDDEDGEDFGC